MLSQDLFGWGLSGEQSVAALLLPFADASEALSQRARRLEWAGESPSLARLAWDGESPSSTRLA